MYSYKKLHSKDDIQEIVRLINECEIVFLAAPVYWANVPAPVKIYLIDYWGQLSEKQIPCRKHD